MKIMSFNTQSCWNYLEEKTDYQIMADAIKQCDADIVGLNEMREIDELTGKEVPRVILSELTGLEYNYFAQAIDHPVVGPYGNAIISKYPFVSVETIPVPDPVEMTGTKLYETRCLLKAELKGGITLLVIHFGLNPDEHINAVKTVVENLEDEKCILMGDFNVLPENSVLDPIKARMKDVADTFDRPLLSFPSDNPREKIDYIFVSHDIEIVSADIPPIVASDHRPHIAEIKISNV